MAKQKNIIASFIKKTNLLDIIFTRSLLFAPYETDNRFSVKAKEHSGHTGTGGDPKKKKMQVFFLVQEQVKYEEDQAKMYQ